MPKPWTHTRNATGKTTATHRRRFRFSQREPAFIASAPFPPDQTRTPIGTDPAASVARYAPFLPVSPACASLHKVHPAPFRSGVALLRQGVQPEANPWL